MIEVTVDVEKAVKVLTDFSRSLPVKAKALAVKLMQEGYDVASVAFANAYYAGTNDVVVDEPAWEGDALVLRARGKAVAFIEFGTGKFYPDYPDQDAYTKLNMSQRGEYGKGKGAHPPWRYIGDPGNAGVVLKHKNDGTDVVQTYGNQPARGMFDATAIFQNRKHVVEIAKEIFRQ